MMDVMVQMADGTLKTLTAEEVATMAHGIISGKDKDIARLREENERLRAQWLERTMALDIAQRERDEAVRLYEKRAAEFMRVEETGRERDEAVGHLQALYDVYGTLGHTIDKWLDEHVEKYQP